MATLGRALVCSLLPAAFGCANPLADVPPGTAPQPPEQAPTGAAPFVIERDGVSARLTPRAAYRVDAVVLIVDDTMNDAWSSVAPLDVALGWGPMSSGTLLRQLSFHLRRRYVSVRWPGDFPLSSKDVMNHLSNHHLLAADEVIASTLEDLRPGDHVQLEGLLVDMEVGARTMRTSLSRTDRGNGACEILFVQGARVLAR